MDTVRQQVMLSQFVYVAGCLPEQAKQLLTESNWQFEAALSRFFQESTPLCRTSAGGCAYPMCTPANTPVTPPNFPDALAALSRLSASDVHTVSSPSSASVSSSMMMSGASASNNSTSTVVNYLSQGN